MSYFCCNIGCIPSFSCQEYTESLAVPSNGASPIRCAGSAEARPWPGPGQAGRGARTLAFLPGAGVAGRHLCLRHSSSALRRPALLRGCFACPRKLSLALLAGPCGNCKVCLAQSVPGWHPSIHPSPRAGVCPLELARARHGHRGSGAGSNLFVSWSSQPCAVVASAGIADETCCRLRARGHKQGCQK